MHHSVKCLTIEVDTGLLLHIMKSFFVYECQRLTKLRKKISITFWAASTAQCSQCTVDIIRPNRRSGSFLFGTPATCAQTEKAIKIPSIGGRATRVGPKEQCIRWNPRSPCGYDNFEGTYAKHPKHLSSLRVRRTQLLHSGDVAQQICGLSRPLLWSFSLEILLT